MTKALKKILKKIKHFKLKPTLLIDFDENKILLNKKVYTTYCEKSPFLQFAKELLKYWEYFQTVNLKNFDLSARFIERSEFLKMNTIIKLQKCNDWKPAFYRKRLYKQKVAKIF